MLKLGDFFHLPQVDALFEQLIADGPGLRIVAGFDPRATTTGGGFLPSGHTTIFRILMREIWAAHPGTRSLVVAEDNATIRVPREFRRQVDLLPVQSPYTYASRIAEAVHLRPELLVIDRLTSENIPAALDAAQHGVRVLSQLDTVFRGTNVARYLLDLGATAEQLHSLTWVITVQRLPALCSHCKQPAPLLPEQLKQLRARYGHFDEQNVPAFFKPGECDHCDQSGRYGDVMVLDIFHANPNVTEIFDQSSLLPVEEYVLNMALHGHLSLQDVIHFEAEQLRRAYNLFITNEHALSEANAALESKVVELESAYFVLEQRTEALFSLQEMGQALISSTEMNDLAAQVCRRARELCGADRAILYFLRDDGQTEVLAVGGWDPALIGLRVDTETVFSAGPALRSYNRLPPGTIPDRRFTGLRAGLYVPLTAQEQRVGAMIVHSARKSSFGQAEVALLQTFANQAALAIQRAELIEQLRAKIAQLEIAQAELARKERMERELELARQVQQSMLPRTFPQIPGYQFAARNEPARQVGGDFYDVIPLGDEHFGIAVADVSDKGMPAALYMALTRSLLLAEAHRERSPSAVLARVNALLLELGEPNMFVTVFYGVIERAARELVYARAGHDRPMLLRAGTTQELDAKGMMLGLLGGDRLGLSEERIMLVPGDRLVLYTDGLTDMMAPNGELFDRARLEALLRRYATFDPAELCEAVFNDLAAYQSTADQFDDTTMLVVSVD